MSAKPLRDFMDDDYHRPTSPDDMRQYHDGCTDDHSPTGMCPCCGVELEEHSEEKWTGKYNTVLCVESQQICPSCGWTSNFLYDA